MHGEKRKNGYESKMKIKDEIKHVSVGNGKVFIETNNNKLACYDHKCVNNVKCNNDCGMKPNQMVSSSDMCKINSICGEDDGVIYDNNGNITSKKKRSHIEVRISESKQMLSTSDSKKEPLPMKLRALPQSFWQQPNNTPSPTLPRKQEDTGGIKTDVRIEDVQTESHEEIVSDANTDLLFSLFHGVEEEQRRSEGPPKVTVIRRGRLKKLRNITNRGALKDDDPYLINTVTESLLPLLPERPTRDTMHIAVAVGDQDSAMISIADEQSTPAANLNTNRTGISDQNYSHILSEVVIRL